MSEEEIDAGAQSDPENPPLTAEDFAAGDVVLPSDRRKVSISTRMDQGALEKFKLKGPRYQTRLNDLMVADSENRVLILDESVVAAYAHVKNCSAIMNAILRQRAPSQGAAPAWRVGSVVAGVQRARTGGKGEWGREGGDGVRIDVGNRTTRHAS
jgi:uncharacterized protein (DUF4415 family)